MLVSNNIWLTGSHKFYPRIYQYNCTESKWNQRPELYLWFSMTVLYDIYISNITNYQKKITNKQRKAIQPFHSWEVCRGIAICFCSICFAVLSDFKWRYDILSSFKICISQFFMFCGMVAMVTSLKLRGFLGYLTFTWENWKFGWKIKRRWPYHLGNRGEERWEDDIFHLISV